MDARAAVTIVSSGIISQVKCMELFGANDFAFAEGFTVLRSYVSTLRSLGLVLPDVQSTLEEVARGPNAPNIGDHKVTASYAVTVGSTYSPCLSALLDRCATLSRHSARQLRQH
jgi:hypothetical protein